jgi:cytochrome c biogenesis protein CcmG/thiol:disulfide interchange protein DsbE
MRRALPVLAATALVGVLVVGLMQAGGGDEEPPRPARPFDLASARAALEGAPEPLAALHAQSNQLLDGHPRAFKERLRSLRGFPVVVNKWASWCGPCRIEFPHFQRVATERGKEIAFLGLNSGDNRGDAEAFLREAPVPYPSYVDPREEIAREAGAPANYPITVFYDSKGERAFVKQGGYRTQADLEADIDKYAR